MTQQLQIPFYYDYACPWAYLGAMRVEAYFSDLPVQLQFLPVHLASIREPADPAAPAAQVGARKAAYQKQDIRNWASFVGAELGDFRQLVRADTALLLRAAMVAQDAGCFRAFHYPAYRARWVDGLDVADARVVAQLLTQAGLDGTAALQLAQSDALAARLAAANAAAMAAGVFGVPTMVVGQRLFWGNDHFEMVHHFIRQQLAGEAD